MVQTFVRQRKGFAEGHPESFLIIEHCIKLAHGNGTAHGKITNRIFYFRQKSTTAAMDRLKTGIIGTGKVAHLHASALANLEESEFTAVCNVNFEHAQVFAEQYHVKAYAQVEEMIAREGIQAVTVATPHPRHAGPAIKAMKAGAHVIVEKPLAWHLER
jgi:hypothetical protein